MDGFTWLLLSWLAVGTFCYFILQKIGATEGTQSSVAGAGGAGEKGAATTESTATHAQYSSDGSTLTHRPSLGVRYDYSNHQPPHINVESSADPRRSSSTQDKWVNDFITWLFNNYKGAPEAANAWLRSLNDASKKVTAPVSDCSSESDALRTTTNRTALIGRKLNAGDRMAAVERLLSIDCNSVRWPERASVCVCVCVCCRWDGRQKLEGNGTRPTQRARPDALLRLKIAGVGSASDPRGCALPLAASSPCSR